jgi:hypothetical protein
LAQPLHGNLQAVAEVVQRLPDQMVLPEHPEVLAVLERQTASPAAA